MWLARMADYSQEVIAFARASSQPDGETMREPLLRDFHMVGSGYDHRDPWETLLIPKTSEGKKAVGGGTKMTYRYYLQDMAFAVITPLPEAEAETISAALQNPCWDLYLGRKSCVPTDIIYRGMFGNRKEAAMAAEEIALEKGRVADYRVLPGEHDGEVITLNDVPVQFGSRKRYRDRQVTVVPP